jgi:murein L,D-transpeptidase YafK
MTQSWCVTRLRIRAIPFAALLSLTACGQSDAKAPQPAAGVKADHILVDKSDRLIILYRTGKEIMRYSGIKLGDVPLGHKHFEGDEKTPEGIYRISGRNPGSRYHLSLRISYPNAADIAYAKARGKPAGGDIFIHGQPNGWGDVTIAKDWTDGCIALSNAQIEQLWNLVPERTPIRIVP